MLRQRGRQARWGVVGDAATDPLLLVHCWTAASSNYFTAKKSCAEPQRNPLVIEPGGLEGGFQSGLLKMGIEGGVI